MFAYAAQIPTDDPEEVLDLDFDLITNREGSRIDYYSDSSGVEMVM